MHDRFRSRVISRLKRIYSTCTALVDRSGQLRSVLRPVLQWPKTFAKPLESKTTNSFAVRLLAPWQRCAQLLQPHAGSATLLCKQTSLGWTILLFRYSADCKSISLQYRRWLSRRCCPQTLIAWSLEIIPIIVVENLGKGSLLATESNVFLMFVFIRVTLCCGGISHLAMTLCLCVCLSVCPSVCTS